MTEDESQPSPAELKKAEKHLSPRELVQSEARHSVIKNQDSLVEIGNLSQEKVQEVAKHASEKALKEYEDLIAQNPWETTINILTGAIEEFGDDDKTLAENHLSWVSDFPTKWKDAMELWSDVGKRKNPNQTFKETLADIRWNNRGPSYIKTDQHGNDYPSFVVMRTKSRFVFEKDLGKEDPKRKELLVPSTEAVHSIFEAFGAKAPTLGKNLEDGDLIDTKLPGVFLSVKGKDEPVITVNFSATTLEKIVTLPHEKK